VAARVEALQRDKKVVAVGECGLDYHGESDAAALAVQATVFVQQMLLANRLRKPLIVHTREAEADTLRLMREHLDPAAKVICHHGSELCAHAWWACKWKCCESDCAGLAHGATEKGPWQWTNPTLSRRTCSPRSVFQSWSRNSAGVAKRPRELIPHPKSLTVRFAPFTSLYLLT
jgi:hypothetical protein